MGTLTVRENLLFSGNLRLPRKQYSTADKEKKVESIIQELGLEDCANTKVGHKCDCQIYSFRCVVHTLKNVTVLRLQRGKKTLLKRYKLLINWE